ncbi:MAG: hypothetical protein JXK16_03675 [Thiotrichales bacterium]|nr:hypothetical protein [Thiotrichales bacterium]
MGKKKQHTKIKLFDFAPDKITIRLIGSRTSKMSDFENLVDNFQQKFSNLHITISQQTLTQKEFSFEIESDTYMKFKLIKKIFNFLKKSVEINDTKDEITGDVYF